jgi:hypothetical protein
VREAVWRFAWTGRHVIQREQVTDREHLGGKKTIETAEAEGTAPAQEVGDMRGLKASLTCENSSIHTASIDPP